MKKFLKIFVFVLISIFCVSCKFDWLERAIVSDEDYEENTSDLQRSKDAFENLIDAINKKDSKALISCFNIYAQRQVSSRTFEEAAQKVFELIPEKITSWNYNGSPESRKIMFMRRYTYYSYDSVTVSTKNSSYEIFFTFCCRDDYYESGIGFEEIGICEKSLYDSLDSLSELQDYDNDAEYGLYPCFK